MSKGERKEPEGLSLNREDIGIQTNPLSQISSNVSSFNSDDDVISQISINRDHIPSSLMADVCRSMSRTSLNSDIQSQSTWNDDIIHGNASHDVPVCLHQGLQGGSPVLITLPFQSLDNLQTFIPCSTCHRPHTTGPSRLASETVAFCVSEVNIRTSQLTLVPCFLCWRPTRHSGMPEKITVPLFPTESRNGSGTGSRGPDEAIRFVPCTVCLQPDHGVVDPDDIIASNVAEELTGHYLSRFNDQDLFAANVAEEMLAFKSGQRTAEHSLGSGDLPGHRLRRQDRKVSKQNRSQQTLSEPLRDNYLVDSQENARHCSRCSVETDQDIIINPVTVLMESRGQQTVVETLRNNYFQEEIHEDLLEDHPHGNLIQDIRGQTQLPPEDDYYSVQTPPNSTGQCRQGREAMVSQEIQGQNHHRFPETLSPETQEPDLIENNYFQGYSQLDNIRHRLPGRPVSKENKGQQTQEEEEYQNEPDQESMRYQENRHKIILVPLKDDGSSSPPVGIMSKTVATSCTDILEEFDDNDDDDEFIISWFVPFPAKQIKDKDTNSLQMSFIKRCGDVIKKSRQRQREIPRLAEARRIQINDSINHATKLRRNKTKPKLVENNQNLIQSANFEFTHKTMRQQTEKIYRRLPEVNEHQKQRLREQLHQTHRLMAQIFQKKLQRATLRGKVSWQITESCM